MFSIFEVIDEIYLSLKWSMLRCIYLVGELMLEKCSSVYCLQLIVRDNEACKMELAHQTWLHKILLELIRMQDGPEGLVASVAMLIAMLSYDTEGAHLFGKDPQTISELILMLVNFSKIHSYDSTSYRYSL